MDYCDYFLQELKAQEGGEASKLLLTEGLLPTLRHLNEVRVRTGRPPPFQFTTQLQRLVQRCFPKGQQSDQLQVPQFKKRSILTMLEYMELLNQFGLLGGGGKSPHVAMFGDSMFERMSKGTHRPQTEPVLQQSAQLFNFSVGGDGVEHLLCRMTIAHRLCFQHTPIFVLMIGINNVMGAQRGNEAGSATSTPQAIAQAIAGIVRFILQNSSTTPQVYVCRLLHIFGSHDLDAQKVNPRVDTVNQLLERIFPRSNSRNKQVELVPTIMPRYKKYYMKDGLHLSHAGYSHLMTQLPRCIMSFPNQPVAAAKRSKEDAQKQIRITKPDLPVYARRNNPSPPCDSRLLNSRMGKQSLKLTNTSDSGMLMETSKESLRIVPPVADTKKQLRKLQKALWQISDLKAKDPTNLDSDQMEKLAKEATLQQKLDMLLKE